jgi:hypothetical protein
LRAFHLMGISVSYKGVCLVLNLGTMDKSTQEVDFYVCPIFSAFLLTRSPSIMFFWPDIALSPCCHSGRQVIMIDVDQWTGVLTQLYHCCTSIANGASGNQRNVINVAWQKATYLLLDVLSRHYVLSMIWHQRNSLIQKRAGDGTSVGDILNPLMIMFVLNVLSIS